VPRLDSSAGESWPVSGSFALDNYTSDCVKIPRIARVSEKLQTAGLHTMELVHTHSLAIESLLRRGISQLFHTTCCRAELSLTNGIIRILTL
jgi:hypothetical protein